MSCERAGQGNVFLRKYPNGAHGKIWWVQFSHGGKTYRESAKSEERGDALKFV